ncbi:MAG: hypothetical protein ACI9D0_000543 [Bacteroidia bacterium]
MNPGGLFLHEGVLFVAGYDKPGSILAFDLDGRRLDSGVVLGQSPGAQAPSISGLAVDADRKLWVADTGSGLVRCVSLFGQEAGSFAPQVKPLEEPLGGQARGDGPVDVALAQSSKWTGVFAAVAGRRVGAVGLYLPDGTQLQTLRSVGDPQAPFRRIARIASFGELLFVVEAGARRVQVFRAGEFHYSFPAGRLGGSSVGPEGRPRALAPVGDGRLVMAVERTGEDRIEVAAGADQNSGLFVLSARGGEEVRLAHTGTGEGEIDHPVDVVVESVLAWGHESREDLDRRRRVVVLDQDGGRIQVFSLAGRCYGSFLVEGAY